LSEEQVARYSGIYITPNGDETIRITKKNSKFGGEVDDKFIPFYFYSNHGDFFVEGYGSNYDGDYQIVMDHHNQTPIYLHGKGRGIVFYFNERFFSPPGPDKPEWKKFVGKYACKMYGKTIALNEISVKNGYLYFDKFRLFEHLPGLFYAPNGEVLDVRSDIPTFRNIQLFKR
jgi:hypothetical protein